jgi:hypothetical protein
LNEEQRAEGAWVFLSHSHQDLEKVREIRNALEAKGQNPLMFFLKCLDDDSELDDLIRREIEARTWFILCESQNASQSRWVQAEVEIIKGLEGKVYEVIDLDGDLNVQIERVTALSKRATVFISYAHADKAIASALHTALRERDFRVFLDVEEIQVGASWRDEIHEAIDRAVQQGFFLLLMSPEALNSQFLRHELDYALQRRAASGRGSNVIPIIAREGAASFAHHLQSEGDLPISLAELEFFDLTAGNLNERIGELIRSLMTREMEE